MLEVRLPSASHVSEDGLPEVPPQELVYGSSFAVKEETILTCSSN